jgi:hypothetical protein
MSQKALKYGSSIGDTNPATTDIIRQSFINSDDNFDELYVYRPINLLDTCAGDSTYASGGGTDDTAAIQAAFNAAVSTGNVPEVWVPGNRTYRVTSTITIPIGITIRGLGGKERAGTATPPVFVWDGAAGGVLFDCPTTNQNIPSTKIINIGLTGRTDLTNLPATLLQFRGTSGALAALDTGSWLQNVFFQVCSGDGIKIVGGATNLVIDGCRWDRCEGYGINAVLAHASGSPFSCTIQGNCTWTTAGTVKGFLFLDAEAGDTGSSNVKIIGLHCEVGQSLIETYAGGTNPYDRRGVIRIGVNATKTSVQHNISFFGLEIPPASGVSSHSIFQITATGGTDDENSRMVKIIGFPIYGTAGVNDGDATGIYRAIGGRIPASRRPPAVVEQSNAIGFFLFGYGKNFNGEHVTSWLGSENTIITFPVIGPRPFSEFPVWAKQGQRGTCTDSTVAATSANFGATFAGGGSNIVPCWHDGTNWRIG